MQANQVRKDKVALIIICGMIVIGCMYAMVVTSAIESASSFSGGMFVIAMIFAFVMIMAYLTRRIPVFA